MNEKMLDTIWKEIEEAPVIAIFRHTQPDMDALNSQAGLKQALLELFPEKTVLALGQQTRDGYVMDEVEDDLLKEALGILLDTSNKDRIDDARYLEMPNTIRFDHHVKVEDLGNLDYVDEKAGATAELLASFFKELGKEIGPVAAQSLYQGLTADTGRFTTSNTRPESLEAGAWLLRQGASVVKTDQVNNGISLSDFKYGALVRRKATIRQKLLYAVMAKTDWLECGLEVDIAAKKAFMLGGVREMEIWALFTEAEDGTFFASLRSRNRQVRDIAAQFGGGGHENAAGIAGLNARQVLDIVKLLSQRSVETSEEQQERQARQQALEEARKAAEAAAAQTDQESENNTTADNSKASAVENNETPALDTSDSSESSVETPKALTSEKNSLAE